jgi:hypothetical protein
LLVSLVFSSFKILAVYSYSKTKGLFAGISIEGSAIIERKEANREFYGSKISAKEILSGKVPPPACADALYDALDKRGNSLENVNRRGEGEERNTMANSSKEPTSSRAPPGNPFTTAPTAGPPAYTSNSSDNSSSRAAYPEKSGPTPMRAAPPVPRRPSKNLAVALYDFIGQQNGDLSFKKVSFYF